MGERKFFFNTQYKFEKEKWYEALKNCRRTVKEIKNSISKKPKNVSYLVNLYEKEGEKAIIEIAEKKKDEIFGIFNKM
jgi:hypothetical protein